MYGFTACYNYKRRSLITSGKISNPFTTQTYISKNFIWDTGASISSIDNTIASKLNLSAVSMKKIQTANGEVSCPIYLVSIILMNDNDNPTFNIPVAGSNLSKETDVLIGMDIISTGSFLFSKHPQSGKLFFEFFSPAMHSFIMPSIIQKIKEQNKKQPK